MLDHRVVLGEFWKLLPRLVPIDLYAGVPQPQSEWSRWKSVVFLPYLSPLTRVIPDAIKTLGVAVYVKDADNVNPLVCCLFLPAIEKSESYVGEILAVRHGEFYPTGYRLELVYPMAHPDRARLYRGVARRWRRLVIMPKHNMKTKAGIRSV